MTDVTIDATTEGTIGVTTGGMIAEGMRGAHDSTWHHKVEVEVEVPILDWVHR